MFVSLGALAFAAAFTLNFTLVGNDFNLNIPRYVDTFEEEAEVDIAAVQKEIRTLESELKEVQVQMNVYLKEIMND